VPERAEITIGDSDTTERTIHLRPWINMADRGWFSGDMHVHRPLADLAVVMEAEDLVVSIPITQWRNALQP